MSGLDFSSVNVLVVGDVILDKYFFGSVSRISPEAPVPVVKVSNETLTLGGAGNVASNIVHLGAEVDVVGWCGRDDNANTLRSEFDSQKINYTLIDRPYPTVTKLRVIGDKQQICRLDFEEIKMLEGRCFDHVKEAVNQKISSADAVIISDYGKGMASFGICAHVVKKAQEAGVPVIVDPKGDKWQKYAGATMITPNVKELAEVYGEPVKNTDEAVEKAAKSVLARFNVKYLIVTRSEKGMSVISKDGIVHFPTEAREVYDVSGAGDTVVATLASALGRKDSLNDAAILANRAAGIVVSKMGTAPVNIAELTAGSLSRKGLVSLEEMKNIRGDLEKKNKKLVFTNGCFDILHKGHLTYLRRAREMGDALIVGLNADSSVRKLKGESRPVNSEEDRAFMLSSLEFVDYVVIFDEDTPHNLIKELRPDLLIKGGDYKPEEVVGREFAGQTVILDFVDGYSTTKIIDNLKGETE